MGDAPILRCAAPNGETRAEMRNWLRNTEEGRALYAHGDCRLMWVNEGDLDRVQFTADIAAAREAELRAERDAALARERALLDSNEANRQARLDANAAHQRQVDAMRAEVERIKAEAHRAGMREATADFTRADWFWRDLDPDDCGAIPEEAINRGMMGQYTICHIRSSFTGPDRFCFIAPVLDPESDDEECLCFTTQDEAIAAAKERHAATLAKIGGY